MAEWPRTKVVRFRQIELVLYAGRIRAGVLWLEGGRPRGLAWGGVGKGKGRGRGNGYVCTGCSRGLGRL